MTDGAGRPRLDPLLLWSVAQTTTEAAVSIAGDGTIVLWNEAAESLLGWAAEEVIGLPMAEVIIPPHLRGAHFAGLHRYRETRVPRVAGRPVTLAALHKDGDVVPVHLTIWPTEGPDGLHFHAFLAAETSSSRERHRLEYGRDQYRRLASSAPGVSFTHRVAPDGRGSTEFVSGGPDLLFGLSASDVPDLELLVHPDDQVDFGIALDVSRGDLSPLSWQGRLTLGDGLERSVLISATPFAGTDGGTQWDGLVIDTTAEEVAQQVILDQARRAELLELALTAVAEVGADAVAVCDASGAVLAATPAARTTHPVGSRIDLTDGGRTEPLRNLAGDVLGHVVRLD